VVGFVDDEDGQLSGLGGGERHGPDDSVQETPAPARAALSLRITNLGPNLDPVPVEILFAARPRHLPPGVELEKRRALMESWSEYLAA